MAVAACNRGHAPAARRSIRSFIVVMPACRGRVACPVLLLPSDALAYVRSTLLLSSSLSHSRGVAHHSRAALRRPRRRSSSRVQHTAGSRHNERRRMVKDTGGLPKGGMNQLPKTVRVKLVRERSALNHAWERSPSLGRIRRPPSERSCSQTNEQSRGSGRRVVRGYTRAGGRKRTRCRCGQATGLCSFFTAAHDHWVRIEVTTRTAQLRSRRHPLHMLRGIPTEQGPCAKRSAARRTVRSSEGVLTCRIVL